MNSDATQLTEEETKILRSLFNPVHPAMNVLNAYSKCTDAISNGTDLLIYMDSDEITPPVYLLVHGKPVINLDRRRLYTIDPELMMEQIQQEVFVVCPFCRNWSEHLRGRNDPPEALVVIEHCENCGSGQPSTIYLAPDAFELGDI